MATAAFLTLIVVQAKTATCLVSRQLSPLAFHSYTSRSLYPSRLRFNTGLKMYSSSLIGKVFVSIEEGIDALDQTKKKNDVDTVVFVDGSWWLGKVRDARSEFEAGPRIAGARFFDIDDIASKGKELNPKDLPHMAPPKVWLKLCYAAPWA